MNFLEKISHWPVSRPVLAGWLAACLAMPGPGGADDTEACMARLLGQASDSTTVGELRSRCAPEPGGAAAGEADTPPPVADERFHNDRQNILQPFTLMAHRPSYFLVAAHASDTYDPDLFREQFNDPFLQFDTTEAQFQFSLKTPLGIDLFGAFDLYAAYTNRSFWQVYKPSISSPFRETNHEPEIWLEFRPGWRVFGFTNLANSVGLAHQSNGRGGLLSRSWNRVFANLVFGRGRLAVHLRPWLRISEDEDLDDNPDITDYLGHYELRADYKWKGHVFSIMSRNNLESGFERGAFELGWSFPLWKYPYLKGYIQYFSGYGESLIDYNQHVNKVGIGFALSDWL